MAASTSRGGTGASPPSVARSGAVGRGYNFAFTWEQICLLCRHRGHSLKNCPNKEDETVDKKLCYNCGENGHSLANCPLPLQDGGTSFAKCFICNETGHLSKN